MDLVESPRVLKGEIADQYLDLPPEVIVTVMQSHQRYVPLKRPQASADPLQLEARSVLLSDYLLVSNGLPDASATIVSGNQRVLGPVSPMRSFSSQWIAGSPAKTVARRWIVSRLPKASAVF